MTSETVNTFSQNNLVATVKLIAKVGIEDIEESNPELLAAEMWGLWRIK